MGLTASAERAGTYRQDREVAGQERDDGTYKRVLSEPRTAVYYLYATSR